MQGSKADLECSPGRPEAISSAILPPHFIGLLVELVFTKTGTDSGQRSAKSSTSRFIGIILAMIAGLAACYALGTAWFMISTGTGLGAALISCVIPFLPGDAAKIIVGTLLVQKLRPAIPIR